MNIAAEDASETAPLPCRSRCAAPTRNESQWVGRSHVSAKTLQSYDFCSPHTDCLEQFVGYKIALHIYCENLGLSGIRGGWRAAVRQCNWIIGVEFLDNQRCAETQRGGPQGIDSHGFLNWAER